MNQLEMKVRDRPLGVAAIAHPPQELAGHHPDARIDAGAKASARPLAVVRSGRIVVQMHVPADQP